ncbi:MAG: radical SAM family heme chaperone HemW [Syntrophaceae bacterium]|nr:radical SAM family heme chaperone HemW [Syntrophaceae bacterium]
MKTSLENRIPGLYIHIPFCKTKCPYCSFYSTTNLNRNDLFLKALADEMTFYRESFPYFDTLYIGGGTPSVMNRIEFEMLFPFIKRNFSLSPHAEITVEINPADHDAEMFSFLKDLGVNRLNIGVQSFDDKVLAFLGRRHNAKEARTAMDWACQAGFEHLGCDLIYGVPEQSIKSWMADLQYAAGLSVDHLSCYQLSLERDTPLGTRYQNSEFSLPDERLQLEYFKITSAYLCDSGFLHYEVSNFARGIDAMARHNRKYWNHTPYLGLGPSAHSFDGRKRWWNRRTLESYLDDLSKGIVPLEEEEILRDDQLRLETLFLGFRTAAGIDINAFKRNFGTDLMQEKAVILTHLQQEGVIVIENGFIRPTLAGMAVADQLALI